VHLGAQGNLFLEAVAFVPFEAEAQPTVRGAPFDDLVLRQHTEQACRSAMQSRRRCAPRRGGTCRAPASGPSSSGQGASGLASPVGGRHLGDLGHAASSTSSALLGVAATGATVVLHVSGQAADRWRPTRESAQHAWQAPDASKRDSRCRVPRPQLQFQGRSSR